MIIISNNNFCISIISWRIFLVINIICYYIVVFFYLVFRY